MGLVGAASEKPSFIFNLIVILIFTIHFLGCFWIYLGKTVEDSWLYEDICNPTVDKDQCYTEKSYINENGEEKTIKV